MEYVGIESIKKAYRNLLQNQGYYEEASSVNMKEFTDPVYDPLTIHPEIEPNLDQVNNSLQKIAIDIIALDAQYRSAANLYDDLMTEVLADLDNVDNIIDMEEERIQDLNIITGHISSFTSVKTFTAKDLAGTCSIENDYTFMCHSTDRTSVNLQIDAVSGNGYEGNTYVYSNGTYENSVLDSSIRNKMIDAYSNTYWEYSKLSAKKRDQYYPIDINFDDIGAECTITISGDSTFNSIRLQSDIKEISVEQISVSDDGGITYSDTMNKPIKVLNAAQKYEDSSYIYGSGLLCFPSTNYAKIRLKSEVSLNEQLAFTKVILDDTTLSQDVTAKEQQDILKSAETVVPLPDTKRYVIRINDLVAFTSTYDTESYLETSELISGPVDCIAVFSNEYYPPFFPSDATIYGFSDYLSYILTVNGQEYTVVPVNSHKNGTKIIRFSDYTITEDYTVHIAEPIKTASLKVKFRTPNVSYSPYLSNLKVCLGKAVIKT